MRAFKGSSDFSPTQGAFTSYWDVCFHFKVNFWIFFFSFGVDLKGFWSPSGKARQNLKHFHWDLLPTSSSSKSPECLQEMLFPQYEGGWWSWEFLSFSLFFSFSLLSSGAWLSSFWCIARLYCLAWGVFVFCFFAWKNRLCSFQISEEPFQTGSFFGFYLSLQAAPFVCQAFLVPLFPPFPFLLLFPSLCSPGLQVFRNITLSS